ncbi:MAG: D-glycero-beta-D-manno-heptose 1-phosphate adenylyltransferase [Acidobacteria bacterium]|nr:MAG: D-glycero-beta-D-manno-heptose 1-phosphate adenylyltransferase [Acidobacteriota bacterium]
MKERIVFTNGCFDLIHPGHIDLLKRAKALGTKLIVGINSDKSVKAIKGEGRPILSEKDRAEILMSLEMVDEVRIFDEPTPEKLIREINPDVLVKGGDWQIDEIIGADFVLERGGKVYSLPLREGYSSSLIIEKISNMLRQAQVNNGESKSILDRSLDEHIETLRLLREQKNKIEACAETIFQALLKGKKILLCGNGGSAADAQHIAAELMGRFEKDRKALSAIALTTDTSVLTALSNDYGFETVFERQVEGLAHEGDVLVGISTSGNSKNVILAVMKARQKGCKTIALTGKNGKKLASLCDEAILVPSSKTSRIQEAHITIGHIWCEIIEEKLSQKDERP